MNRVLLLLVFDRLTETEASFESFNSMKNKRPKSDERDMDDDGDLEAEECDMEVWNSLSKSFRQVQSVLDHNRSLIQQVNENHQSRISDNLVKNVSLIREINGNISRVISIYSDLSANFSCAIQQRRPVMESKSCEDDGGGGIDKAGNADG